MLDDAGKKVNVVHFIVVIKQKWLTVDGKLNVYLTPCCTKYQYQ